MFENKQILVFFEYDIFEPPERYKIQRKTALLKCGVSFGGLYWIPSDKCPAGHSLALELLVLAYSLSNLQSFDCMFQIHEPQHTKNKWPPFSDHLFLVVGVAGFEPAQA